MGLVTLASNSLKMTGISQTVIAVITYLLCNGRRGRLKGGVGMSGVKTVGLLA